MTLTRMANDPVLPGASLTETEGSLYVYGDAGAADAGVRQCESAGDLLCYQAGNVTIIIEGGTPTLGQTRLATAIEEMGN